MNKVSLILLLLHVLLTGCAKIESWQCSANGLEDSFYDGNNQAFIHLQGSDTGTLYSVKLNKDRTEASGETDNGTPFTCAKIK